MNTRLHSSFCIPHSSLVVLAALILFISSPCAPGQSVWTNALSFDGVNDQVIVANFGGAMPTNEVTVEFWERLPVTNQIMTVFRLQPDDTANRFMFDHRGDGSVIWDFGNIAGGGRLSSGPGITVNDAWQHFAMVARAGTGANDYMAIYCNGVLRTNKSGACAFAKNISSLYLGQRAAYYLRGELDDFRIWNKARSQAEIQADMAHPLTGLESNLVAYWKFDEGGSTTTAHDATPNHFDGVLDGPVWVNSTVPPFVGLNFGLPGVWYSSVAWGDYDNDGRLDLLLTGATREHPTYSPISQVWRNTGSGFTNVTSMVAPGLPGVYQGSVAWGDYDNDGRLDILLTGITNSAGNPFAQVWRNTGTGFSNTVVLPGVWSSSVAWGDYDNDGRLDILMVGATGMTDWTGFPANPVTRVWRSTGSGFTNVTSTVAPGLPGVMGGSVAWGDYDNDGRLDFLLTGWDANNNWFGQVWRNTGSGFTNINTALPPGSSSVAWGDYDNDGRLDILLAGRNGSSAWTQVWRNTGSGFANINAGLTGAGFGSVAWGDYDNDGRLDILLTGTINDFGSGSFSQVWRNTGSGFINISAGLPGAYEGSAAWGDYDNDGRLDILLTGNSALGTYIAQVWRNIGSEANTPPSAPSNLAATEGKLGWDAAADEQTPAAGLTYNLRVGTNPDGSDIVSPQANGTNGFRRLPAMGNAQHGLGFEFSSLPWGIYYWSVQAVDSAFGGSAFAPEQRLVIAVQTLPATGVGLSTATLNGAVNPLGRPTTAWFEWGADTSYGQTTPVLIEDNRTNALPVTTVLTGLVLHAYHYRVMATNDLGLIVGADALIPMQLERPQVVGLQPTDVTSTSLTLRGEVNPRERETIAWFEYGLTVKYGATTTLTNVGIAPDDLQVRAPVSGLLPWMTYHYRVMASNSVGITIGGDNTVTLPGPSLAGPSLSALPAVTLAQGGSTSIWFTVSPADATVRVQCNNPVLMPGPANLVLGGSGSARSLTLTPDSSHSGSAVVTVSASDDAAATRASFALSVTPSGGQQSSLLYLTNTAPVSAQSWRFQLVDNGTGSTNYTVEYRSDLSPTNQWIAATNVTSLGEGLYRVDTGPPDRGFYRVRGFLLLLAGLGTADLSVDEGAGQVGPVVIFNAPYVGTVNYTWTDASGTTTGTVQVNGDTAVIPVPLTDDVSIDQLRCLTLRLETGSGYSVAGTPQGNVTIEENDADWQGTLVIPNGLAGTTTASLTNGSGGFTNVTLPQNTNTLLGFTLRIQQTSGSLQGQIQSDAYGFLPTNALAQLTFTESHFTAVATNIPLPALTGSPLYSAPHHLDLRLDAANAPGSTNVSPTRINGVATLVSVVPGRPYLDTALSGTFLLLKPPGVAPTNEVPLQPAP
jgi:hypothetical protein